MTGARFADALVRVEHAPAPPAVPPPPPPPPAGTILVYVKIDDDVHGPYTPTADTFLGIQATFAAGSFVSGDYGPINLFAWPGLDEPVSGDYDFGVWFDDVAASTLAFGATDLFSAEFASGSYPFGFDAGTSGLSGTATAEIDSGALHIFGSFTVADGYVGSTIATCVGDVGDGWYMQARVKFDAASVAAGRAVAVLLQETSFVYDPAAGVTGEFTTFPELDYDFATGDVVLFLNDTSYTYTARRFPLPLSAGEWHTLGLATVFVPNAG